MLEPVLYDAVAAGANLGLQQVEALDTTELQRIDARSRQEPHAEWEPAVGRLPRDDLTAIKYQLFTAAGACSRDTQNREQVVISLTYMGMKTPLAWESALVQPSSALV